MDKMVYLSERMFFQEGTTDAGYLDQCARLRNQLGGMTQVQQYICSYVRGLRRRRHIMSYHMTQRWVGVEVVRATCGLE